MTRDEILAMEAGPDLDALVAEITMGWHRSACWDDGSFYWLTTQTGHEKLKDWRFKPSQEIAAAWQVEERIKELGLTDKYSGELVKLIRLTIGKGYFWDLAHAPPELRCKAALIAVGEETKE